MCCMGSSPAPSQLTPQLWYDKLNYCYFLKPKLSHIGCMKTVRIHYALIYFKNVFCLFLALQKKFTLGMVSNKKKYENLPNRGGGWFWFPAPNCTKRIPLLENCPQCQSLLWPLPITIIIHNQYIHQGHHHNQDQYHHHWHIHQDNRWHQCMSCFHNFRALI